MLTEVELIDKLKSKGVTFNYFSEYDAAHFLREHNYYVKLSSYRHNFHKRNGKYVGLDFKALVDLSTIDMHLKFILLKSILNLEHALKVNLLKDIETKNIDDYKIVQDYCTSFPKTLKNIENHRNTSYAKLLLSKHTHPHYPIWVLLEVISFGDLVNFYKYYSQTYNYKIIPVEYLYNIIDLRNACAHSNCLIHNMTNRSGYFEIKVVKNVKRILPHYSERSIKLRLKNKTTQDFTSLILSLNKVIKSGNIYCNRIKEIKEFFNYRMVREKELYKTSQELKQTYYFLQELLDNL